MNNKKKIILGSIIGVLVGSLLGISYAMFTFNSSSISNKLIAGDIYMRYKDNNKEIDLENAMPSSSYTGGDYFEFEIIGKNTSSNTIYYELLLNHGDVPTGKTESNRIADEFLRFRLVEVNNDTEGNDLLTNTQIYNIDKERIYVGTIGTTNSYSKTYRLYCWIDNSLVIGEDYTQSEWNNLFASIGVDVVGDFTVKTVPTYALITYNANGGVVKPSKKQIATNSTTYGPLAEPTRDDEYTFDGWYTAAENGTKVESTTTYNHGTSVTTLYAHWKIIPTIDSCPGCKFIYTTNHYCYQNFCDAMVIGIDEYLNQSTTNDIQNKGDQLYDDYNDVITNDRKYFLGFKIENDTIVKTYSCGIKTGSEDVPFCIEASTDGSTYNANVSLITGPTLWNDPTYNLNRCRHYSNDERVECGITYGEIAAEAGAYGYASVTMYDGTGKGCFATDYGLAFCRN